MLSFTQQIVSFEHNGHRIVGTKYTPAKITKDPVLLVHGFGSNRIGVGRSFVRLARMLVNEGFEVFSFDRLGQGESDKNFIEVGVLDEVEQLENMLDFVLINGMEGAHVIGHSLGGMEAAVLASRKPKKVKSLTLWAPAAVFAFETAEKREIQGKSIEGAEEKGYFDFKGQKLGWKFIQEAINFKPYHGLESFTNPAFIHHGKQDPVVPMKYAESYALIWKNNGTLYTYEEADHGWNQLEEREKLLKQTVTDLLNL